jgi:hypothetical protein
VLPRPEYPRPRLRRESWVNLNGEWDFGSGVKPTLDRRIQVPFCPQSELSGLREQPGDVVWYRRRFEAPPAERLHLHFGAVDHHATVWVNGVEVARHTGGHTPFSADVTGAITGRDDELVLRIQDPLSDRTLPRGKQNWRPEPEGIFYTPTTGIWQTVWLEPLPERHVRGLRLWPDLEAGRVAFEVAAEGEVEIVAAIDGRTAGSWSGPAGRGSLTLDPVLSWSPGQARLYDLVIRLFEGGHEVDRVESYFGLRKVETRDGRFLLNGAPFIQRLVLDQGYFPGGLLTAGDDRTLRADIELAIAMGFNGARKHQKIEDPRWLYWADALGFVVWEEMPGFHQHSAEAEARLEAEWAAAVLRDRDHPCVVAWVPFNESFGLQGIAAQARAQLLGRLFRLTHELDGSRPVVSNDGWEHAATDLCTLHDYGSATELAERYRSLESALEPSGRPCPPFLPGFAHSGQPLIVSEFGGLKLAGSGGWGYGEVAGPQEFANAYGELVAALLGRGPVEGFCYTQLTDVGLERNGLLDFERRPKVDLRTLKALTQTPKSR